VQPVPFFRRQIEADVDATLHNTTSLYGELLRPKGRSFWLQRQLP
jgi:hypothetical protein